MGSKPYLIINFVLAGLILMIFLYSGLFSAEKDRHPVPSFYEEISGEKPPSSGMSRAFSELIRGDLESAKKYNEDSPLIFAFFLLQLLQRIIVQALLYKKTWSGRYLLIADIAGTMILFLYCFKGQILKMAEMF